MSFRSFLIFMSLSTVAAWIAWVVVINGIDPTRAGAFGLILFYITLGIAFFGSLSIFGVIIRLWLHKNEIVSRLTLRSSRQAFILASIFILALILFSNGLLMWWSMLLIVMIGALSELFLSKIQL